MDCEACICAMKSFGNVAVDYLPDVLEPFSKYGKAIGTLVKMVKEGKAAVEKELSDLEDRRGQEFEAVKKEAYEEFKILCDGVKKPVYADVVIFYCKNALDLSSEQKELIKMVLLQEYESDDNRCLEVISAFLEKYMGGSIDVESADDCEIGDTYVNFTFSPYEEHSYNAEDMNAIMEALNSFLEVDVFDYFMVGGHDESWELE